MSVEMIKKIPNLQAALRGTLAIQRESRDLLPKPPQALGTLHRPADIQGRIGQKYEEQQAEYQAALEELMRIPDRHIYGILAMHYVGGMSYTAIARELGGRHTTSSVQQECSRFFTAQRHRRPT